MLDDFVLWLNRYIKNILASGPILGASEAGEGKRGEEKLGKGKRGKGEWGKGEQGKR